MNTALLQRNPIDPLLNVLNCRALSVLYDATPEMNLRQIIPQILSPDENVGFRALDDVATPTAWASANGEMIIWCAGTSGRIHAQQLLDGWTHFLEDWNQTRGACPAFYNAARAIITAIGPLELLAAHTFYLIGHSYGGATMEAMAGQLRGATNATVKIWSYGSPRPGTYTLGSYLATLQNTRFFIDEDPVRWIPPHSSEVSSLTAVEDSILIRGMNQQVQPPLGYELQADGRIVQTEGVSTALHAVAISVLNWCFDVSGFRSANHAITNYVRRFTLAANAQAPVIQPGTLRPREQPEDLTSREMDRWADKGIDELNSALETIPNINTVYEVPQLPANSPLRYRRRKVGRVWGVKLGDQVVAIGPGKRKALKLARGFNRAAFANR